MMQVYKGEIGKVLTGVVGYDVPASSTLVLDMVKPGGTASTAALTLNSTLSGAWSYTTTGTDFDTEGNWLAQVHVTKGTTTSTYGPVFPIQVLNSLDA